MSKNYYFSPYVRGDIDHIIDYFAGRNINALETLLESFYEILEKISQHPFMGHTREDVQDKSLRFITFQWDFMIIYKPTNPVEILRVVSGHQNISALSKQHNK